MDEISFIRFYYFFYLPLYKELFYIETSKEKMVIYNYMFIYIKHACDAG